MTQPPLNEAFHYPLQLCSCLCLRLCQTSYIPCLSSLLVKIRCAATAKSLLISLFSFSNLLLLWGVSKVHYSFLLRLCYIAIRPFCDFVTEQQQAVRRNGNSVVGWKWHFSLVESVWRLTTPLRHYNMVVTGGSVTSCHIMEGSLTLSNTYRPTAMQVRQCLEAETLAIWKSGPLFAWTNMMLLSLRGWGGDWFSGEMVLRSARDAIFRCWAE